MRSLSNVFTPISLSLRSAHVDRTLAVVLFSFRPNRVLQSSVETAQRRHLHLDVRFDIVLPMCCRHCTLLLTEKRDES